MRMTDREGMLKEGRRTEVFLIYFNRYSLCSDQKKMVRIQNGEIFQKGREIGANDCCVRFTFWGYCCGCGRGWVVEGGGQEAGIVTPSLFWSTILSWALSGGGISEGEVVAVAVEVSSLPESFKGKGVGEPLYWGSKKTLKTTKLFAWGKY